MYADGKTKYITKVSRRTKLKEAYKIMDSSEN